MLGIFMIRTYLFNFTSIVSDVNLHFETICAVSTYIGLGFNNFYIRHSQLKNFHNFRQLISLTV